MKAFVFPGQGAQFVGMGKDLYDLSGDAKELFERGNDILGFRISDLMFNGTDADLKRTEVTQPAVFIHSYVSAKMSSLAQKPNMVAGHSLGEFTALAISEALSYEDALSLVSKRASAMQRACEEKPSTMAAIIGLTNEQVEEICAAVQSGIVVAANYNCPGQVVISGEIDAVNEACEKAKEAGAKRALPLKVGGAFHSPLMESAHEKLAQAIESTKFGNPICPIYQNVDALPHTNPEEIKENLIKQLTAPVRWTQSVQQMIADGCTEFIEFGPGNVLQGLIKKIDSNVTARPGL